MTQQEAYQGVRQVLASVSNADPAKIRKPQKLKVFVPPYAVLTLALAIDRRFPAVDLTDLVNSLYDPVATVGDLVDYVVEAHADDVVA